MSQPKGWLFLCLHFKPRSAITLNALGGKMKTLDKGADKIEKISELLRKQTLEPAQAEAEKLRREAREDAAFTVAEAKAQAEELVKNARLEIERERAVFHSSLKQASKQTLETLRQAIEYKLFDEELDLVVVAGSADPKGIARLIEAIVRAVEEEGISSDLAACIPKAISKEEVAGLLAKQILVKLPGGIKLGGFAGGAQVELVDKQIRLDVSDEALIELLKRYVRKSFRELLFGTK